MRTKKYDGADLRRVLVGMVTADVVLARIASRWTEEGLFDSRWANLVGGWCVKYFTKHKTAPDQNIRGIFERWAETSSETEEVVEAVERFILGLSDTAEELDASYLLDIADDHFNAVRLKSELKLAQIEIDRGLVKEASDRVASIHRVELGVGSFVEPAADYSVWHQAFENDGKEPLVSYPGDIGTYFADAFKRGEFYAFMGPDKTGKTVWLIDLAYRALRNRNKVVFFDAGDSTQDDVMLRLACRIANKPDIEGDCPKPIGWDDEGKLEMVYENETAVNPSDAYRALKKRVRSKNSFRLSCHANSTLSVAGVDALLADWSNDDWVPDVVVIDYADIMAYSAGSDNLEQIDNVWKDLRRLSQERHCLVVTATQSNAAAYGKDKALLTRANFSGRKTKLAHVNGMIGINVSQDERATHQARLNWVVRRKMRNRNGASCVHVAGCYNSENPIIISRY
jgi:hypothetical protein